MGPPGFGALRILTPLRGFSPVRTNAIDSRREGVLRTLEAYARGLTPRSWVAGTRVPVGFTPTFGPNQRTTRPDRSKPQQHSLSRPVTHAGNIGTARYPEIVTAVTAIHRRAFADALTENLQGDRLHELTPEETEEPVAHAATPGSTRSATSFAGYTGSSSGAAF